MSDSCRIFETFAPARNRSRWSCVTSRFIQTRARRHGGLSFVVVPFGETLFVCILYFGFFFFLFFFSKFAKIVATSPFEASATIRSFPHTFNYLIGQNQSTRQQRRITVFVELSPTHNCIVWMSHVGVLCGDTICY